MRTAFRVESASAHGFESSGGSARRRHTAPPPPPLPKSPMSAPQAKRLKTALLAADGVSAADAVKKLAGSGVNLEQLSACLRAAASTLDKEVQVLGDVKACVPSGKPVRFNGFDLDSGVATELQRALILHLDVQSKGRLACVSKYWHEAAIHPAFWADELRLPPSKLVTVKDFVSWLDARAMQFVMTKRLVWPTGTESPGTGVLAHALKLCAAVEHLDIRGMPAKDPYGYETHTYLITAMKDRFHSFYFNWSSLVYLQAYDQGTATFGPLTDFLPGQTFNRSIPSSFEFSAQQGWEDGDEVTLCIFPSYLQYGPSFITWNFPELRHLELQSLPTFARGTAYNVYRPSAARIVADMIKGAPKLETFILRDSRQPENVLEIDVDGVRGGHLPPTYPVSEYTVYLQAWLAGIPVA